MYTMGIHVHVYAEYLLYITVHVHCICKLSTVYMHDTCICALLITQVKKLKYLLVSGANWGRYVLFSVLFTK